MTEEQVDRMISDNEAIVVGCTYNIMFTNDLVCGAVVEALAGLRKSAMCRHETKKEAGRVEKERKDYERMVNGVVRRSADFFADANDAFTGEVAKHVEVLYWSIKDELDKKKVAESGVVARLETARTLADFAVWQFDKRMQELEERDRRFKGLHIDYLRMTRLRDAMNRLMGTLKIGVTVNMNTERICRAVDVVSLQVGDPERIARAISV